LIFSPHVEQSKYFLNAYFHELTAAGELDNVWKWTYKFIELDTAKGANGDSLDEFGAHRFLESIGTFNTFTPSFFNL